MSENENIPPKKMHNDTFLFFFRVVLSSFSISGKSYSLASFFKKNKTNNSATVLVLSLLLCYVIILLIPIKFMGYGCVSLGRKTLKSFPNISKDWLGSTSFLETSNWTFLQISEVPECVIPYFLLHCY